MKWRALGIALVSLALLAGAVHLANVSPMEALSVLLKNSFGSPKALAGTLKETTPLLIAGLAVFVGLKAGLFNIGVEGQFLIGALFAACVGLRVPGWSGVVLGVVAGIAGGALWALPAALIKACKNGHEVITTIMLNNVAGALTLALVKGPLRDPGQEGSTTSTLAQTSWLPAFEWGTPTGRFSVSLLVGLILVAASAVWLRKTVAGYELRATGAGPSAAAFAGVRTKTVILWALCGSGALGGLAGALHVFASEHRFYDGFSSGYGFDALGVALLAGASPYGLIPAALMFGALAQGSTGIQILGVPKGLTYVILGLLVLSFAVVRFRRPETHD